MSSSASTSSDSSSLPYAISMDNQEEVDLLAQSWQFPTIIEDDDITFDGKPLSDLYEEDRRRLSAVSNSSDDDEEERRGRQRVRQEYSNTKDASKKI